MEESPKDFLLEEEARGKWESHRPFGGPASIQFTLYVRTLGREKKSLRKSQALEHFCPCLAKPNAIGLSLMLLLYVSMGTYTLHSTQ